MISSKNRAGGTMQDRRDAGWVPGWAGWVPSLAGECQVGLAAAKPQPNEK
ncbi:hypothetical protein INS90_01965 [Trueperella pecoris]|uniref:Uncharacterized protein n=1 Tax=Trueperella pecoris TaxID=2733571 RepID=A0A7M1R3L1_9ACTO|nr:hypothetical protein [Trueperella pecoris]QOR48087.1 hypothetical protein INS90_01965 [Trueperella pecoris]